MFTNWDQIESWIRDNQFVHWVFFKGNPNDREDKANDKIADSNYYTGGDEDKLAMTKKYLMLHGGHAYGLGFKSPNTTQGGTICEVRLDPEIQVAAPASGVGIPPQSIGELRESLRKELQTEWDKKECEKMRKDLEADRKAFEAEKQSAMGFLVGYLAPLGKAFLQKKVAGVDTAAPVEAEPVHPIVAKEVAAPVPGSQAEQDPFTDEEADKLYDLLARFKKVEPQYMQLIEAVVEMAEKGDQTYTMAKGFLIK
ncbi:MAG: hypothetical protein J6Q19_04780 [Bacteroidaceae bacterium]|nr:hypothetical protein [Bacteroidaceae bacterium]